MMRSNQPSQNTRGFILLLVALAILVIGIEAWRRSGPEPTSDDAINETIGDAVPTETVSGATTPTDDTTATKIEPQAVMPPVVANNVAPITHASQPLADEIPDLRTLRAEAQRDPHNTPPALLKFSIEISRRVNAEAGTEAGATALFAEFEDCVMNPKQKGSATVQALCLLNAHRLAQHYPSLVERDADLVERSDAEAVRRAKALY